MTKRAKEQGKPSHRLGQHLPIRAKLHAWVDMNVKQGKGKPDIVQKKKVVRPRLMHAWLKVQEGLAAMDAIPRPEGETQKDRIARALSRFETEDRVAGRGKAEKSVYTLYGPQMASFENFVLMVISVDEPDHQLVKRWEDGDATFKDPFTVETIVLYLRYLTEPLNTPLGINASQLLPGYQ